MTSSGELIATINGADLCFETFGSPADPAILLIGGAAGSMDWWETDFCERLAAGPHFVIRYDLRDTGRSASSPAGAPDYGIPEVDADALGLLDELGIDRAHLAGISFGGGIAQRLAVHHPDRVASLTLLSTSPGGPGNDANGLPPMSPEIAAAFAEPAPEPDWTDRAAVIDYLVDGVRLFAGSLPFDEAGTRALAAQMIDRTTNVAASQTNHWVLAGGGPVRPRLGEISAPTLVLHGTDDPLFPIGHGEALAREIPGARLVALQGVGHEMPPHSTWDVVVPAIVQHTA
jgi:pimeloyl-ACP methyl ester carboxylesterase